MEYSCCVPGCKSNYKKDEPSVTVFKFLSIGELRQKLCGPFLDDYFIYLH